MTRKDYIVLAAAFAGVVTEEGEGGTWSELRYEVANVLAADNPRFDRARFYSACVTVQVAR